MAPQNRVTRLVIKNLLLGVLSLILGFLSWMYLTSKVESEKKATLTLEFRFPADGNYAAQPVIRQLKGDQLVDSIEVEFRIRGLKDKINTLDTSSLRLVYNVTREEYDQFTVDPDMIVNLDSGLTARVVNPQTYRINFARQFAVPATLKLDYNRVDFAKGGRFFDDWLDPSYDLNPRRITVTGRLDKLQIAPDQQILLYTRKLDLSPDDVKAGAWKRTGKIELSEKAEIVDSQNNHIAWVVVTPELPEASFDLTIPTRPESGAVKIPLQVLPPLDRLRLGTTDAFDTYVLAEGAPREVTVQYTKPRKSTAVMDSTRIFAFVNVTAPGNLNNLPISIYTVHNDPGIKVWLAAGQDGAPLHANVKVIQADVGASIRAQGPFPVRALFGQPADRRYQVTIAPLAFDNLLAKGSNKSLGDKPIGSDEIALLVEIPHSAFTDREFEQDLPLLVIKPERVTTLTTADGKPLPTVRVRVTPPPHVPDSKPQLIGDVAVEIEYPQNFELRVVLSQNKIAVSATGAKETIDALRPDMLIAVVRPNSDDDRPDFTGKAKVVGVFRKILDNGKIVGLEPVPDVLFIPADKVEFKTQKTINTENTLAPENLFAPGPANPGTDPQPLNRNNQNLPPPPPYGS